MRISILIMIVFVGSGIASAQTPNNSIYIDSVRAIVGEEQTDARILFVGDGIRPYLDGSEKKLRGWNNAKRKTDVFIVFSDKTKKLLEQKVKKKVVLGKSFGSFFTRSWPGQDFVTWIDLKGDKVVFVETSPEPSKTPHKRAVSEEDRKLAEYVTSVSNIKRKVEVLVVGTTVDKAYLDTTDLSIEFEQLDKRLSYLIVHSEKLKEAFSSITKKDIYVKETVQESIGGSGSMDRLRWAIVEAEGSNLITLRGSSILKSIIKPQFANGKTQE